MAPAADKGPQKQTQLTVRGLLLLVFAGLLIIPGIFIGSSELVSICGVLVAVVGASYAIERISRPADLRSIAISPQPASVGETVTFNPEFRHFDDNWRITFAPAPDLGPTRQLPPNETVYRTVVRRRGLHQVRSLQATRTDVLGLARTALEWTLAQEVTVYPRLFDLSVPRPGSGAGSGHGLFRASNATDDISLRSYVPGDEIRRIHWPATARHGEMMVRSEEANITRRLNLVLDNRDGSHERLEWVVSVAASIALAAISSQWVVRVLHAPAVEAASPAPQFNRQQSLLDFATMLRPGDFDHLLAACAQFSSEDITIAIAQTFDSELQLVLKRMPQMRGVLAYERDTGQVPAASSAGGLRIVYASSDDDLPQVWRTFTGVAQ